MGIAFVGLFFGTGALLLGLATGYPCPSDPVGQVSIGCPTAQLLALHILLPLGIVVLSTIGFVVSFRKRRSIQSGTA
jgi:hypothetical protein